MLLTRTRFFSLETQGSIVMHTLIWAPLPCCLAYSRPLTMLLTRTRFFLLETQGSIAMLGMFTGGHVDSAAILPNAKMARFQNLENRIY